MILTTLPATNVRTARRGDGGLHPGTASQITMQAGNGQSALAGTAVAIAPAVLVRDQLDQPVAGASVQFVVTGGSSASEVTADSFTRANENPLAGNWTKAGGAATNLQLVSNAVQGVTLSGEGLMFYNAVTWPADQYAECQITALGAGGSRGGGPAVRMSAAGETAYMAQVQSNGTRIDIARWNTGTYTLLQQITTTVGSTDTIRLEVRGSTIRVFRNGAQIGTDIIDGVLASGNAGLDLFSNTTFTIDNWAGGVPPSTSGTVTPDTPIVTTVAGIAAATTWTLGTVAGTNTVTVTTTGLAGSPLSFTATGTAGGGVATQIAINGGNNQTATPGATLPTPPSVIVRDAGGAPVAGVLVTFAIASGGGSLTGASQTTNASGIATVGSWTLGTVAGTNTLTAASAGLTGSPVTITAMGAAQLVFEELFTGTTQAYYEARGWYDGTVNITTGAGDGYKFLTDGTLGRNVLYAHWATTTPTFSADPKEMGVAWRLPFAVDANGATCYVFFKTHNMMGAAFGIHHTRLGRGWGTFTPSNSDGQMVMDIVAQAAQNLIFDVATGLEMPNTSGVFRTFYEAQGAKSWAAVGPGGLLTDDTWYEMAYYIKPSSGSGTNDGELRVVVRSYGTAAWTIVMVGLNIATALGTGLISHFLIALYGAGNTGGTRWTNDIRAYFGTIRLFSGDAITSGAALPGGFIPDFYVSPTGGTGTGSVSDPWSLTYAFSGAGGAITPGKKVALRGGTYTGAFTCTVSGTQANPVVFRQYPGERATIAGNLVAMDSTQDVWFWGFEIDYPNPGDGTNLQGVNGRCVRGKYINLVVHDCAGTGMVLFDKTDDTPSVDSEIYGCVVYHNGHINNQGQGIYITNQTNTKTVRDNIVFNNWVNGIQAQGTGPTQYTNNITSDGNIVFNNNSIGPSAGFEILYARPNNDDVHTAIVTNNCCYRNDRLLTANLSWYFSGAGSTDLQCVNNIFVGTLEIDDWAGTVTVQNNKIYGDTTASVYAQGVTLNRGALTGHTYSGNSWYCSAALLGFGYKPTAGPGATTQYTFANWKTATGFTTAGTLVGATPTGTWVVVRANQYEPGRANIAIYNWDGLTSVPVDLTGILTIGSTYAVRHVFDFYGTPLVSGIYAGTPISVPMTALAPPTPKARPNSHIGATPGPTFGAFVLQAT